MYTVSQPPRRDAFGITSSMLLWAVVVALTLLSFYVHLLNEHMLSAQGLRIARSAPQLQKAAERPRLPALNKAPQGLPAVPSMSVESLRPAHRHLQYPAL